MYVLYTDGGIIMPNPGGTTVYGWLIYDGDEIVASGHGKGISGPEATTNVAEYLGLINGLEAAILFWYK